MSESSIVRRTSLIARGFSVNIITIPRIFYSVIGFAILDKNNFICGFSGAATAVFHIYTAVFFAVIIELLFSVDSAGRSRNGQRAKHLRHVSGLRSDQLQVREFLAQSARR